METEVCSPHPSPDNDYLLLQDLYTKGDDIQKLSVIQALPQLLQNDPNGTLTRIIPKIQEELPRSSCEFHIATSKIFKLLIEKQLPLNLTPVVLQGTKSKDPVVASAWIETLLAVIPVLTIDQIKSTVVPDALAKSQPTSPMYCRMASCKIFGRCASHPKMQSIDVKTTILPAVQNLCQDSLKDVRATMCSQLHFIAQGLGENLIKSSLLPTLVELASEDNMAIRSAAVATAILITPFLNKQTKIETIVPLIKQLCQNTVSYGDTTFPTVAKEFGKLVESLQSDLDAADCIWLLQFFKSLSARGQAIRLNKDNQEVTQDLVCREQCAQNLPAVTAFTVIRIPNQLDLWHSIFSSLANDSCYLVRKNTAACIYEVTKLLGPQCKLIKDDLVKLLRDDSEEVLHMLVPHIGKTLELLSIHGVLSREQMTPACLEITRAILKCQAELAKGFNWRIKTNLLEQLEHLPNCLTSDFIHQHFNPIILNCILEARSKPVRSQASRTLLVFLRYNLKESQRKWIRDNLITHLRFSRSCYTRHIFILACGHAIDLFSNVYFKKYFFESLLSLADDPVINVRLCVIALLPALYKMLNMPEDRKLQTNIDNLFSKLDMVEKDRDVKAVLRSKLKEIRSFGPSNKHEYMLEQKRKEEEENKVFQGKIPTTTLTAPTKSATHISRDPVSATSRGPAIIARSPSAPPRVTPKTSSTTSAPSEMSFLEQHFYIDAGITLPRDSNTEVDFKKTIRNFQKLTANEPAVIPTVSAETVNIEAMSDSELKQLETSTTNITDDVKVNLRKRCTKSSNRNSFVRTSTFTGNTSKRYSSVFPVSESASASSNVKVLNRRSLNVGAGDVSRIPVCIKKSQSTVDVKTCETKLTSRKSDIDDLKTKNRPKSEVLLCTNIAKINNNDDDDDKSGTDAINNSIKDQVPTSSINNNVPKTSGLPVLKRRTQSEARK